MTSLVILVLGLINPERVTYVTRKTLSRKQIGKFFGTLMVASFFLIGFTAPTTEQKTSKTSKIEEIKEIQFGESGIVNTTTSITQIEEKTPTKDEKYADDLIKQNSKDEPQTIKKEDSQKIDTPSYQYYKVAYVVDGDTIDVMINEKKERLRLIGINTPETKDPGKPVECFGKEASDKATQLLYGQMVRLEADPTQGERDKYGRLLRYVHRLDGLNFNKWMIEQGYAYEYTYDKIYAYQSQFKAAQSYAQKNRLGLWADGICDNFNNQILKKEDSIKDIPSDSPQKIQNDSTPPNEQCVIKGNINSKKEKLYHNPYCPSYSRTKIDESKGELWFCNEEDAINAGWTKAGNC